MYFIKNKDDEFCRIWVDIHHNIISYNDKLNDICIIIQAHKIPHYLVSSNEYLLHTNYSAYLIVDNDQIPFAILCGLEFLYNDRSLQIVAHHRNFLFEGMLDDVFSERFN